MNRLKCALMVVLGFLVSGMLPGQSTIPPDSLRAMAERHILALHEGTLLVRLQSNDKKVAAIEAILDTANLDQKERERLESMRSKTLEETKQYNSDIVSAFNQAYNFSRVAYFFDSDSKKVLSGATPALQADLTTPVDTILPEPIYILSVGETPQTSLKGYVVLDNSLKPVPRPFPNNVTRGGFAGLFASLWGDGEVTHIERLNHKLWRFYNSAVTQE